MTNPANQQTRVNADDLPRIAVVTPSFNTAQFLGAAIHSVIDQNYPNLDYIVMDGGSTDGSADVLKSFGDRVRWVSQSDAGQSDAIARGFAQTTGEILGWLNSDDLYCPGAFEAVAEFFRDHPAVDVVYGDANYVDVDGKKISACVHIEPYSKKRLLSHSDFIVQPATFFRRSAYEAAGGMNAKFNWALDYDLWIRMAEKSKFVYLPKLLANYRWVGSNKSAAGGWSRLDEIVAMFTQRGQPIPVYIRLEQINQHAHDCLSSLFHFKLARSAKSFATGAKMALSSPPVMVSFLSPRVWRMAWVGQVLRRRAAR